MSIETKWFSLETAKKNAPETEGIYKFGITLDKSTKIVYIGKSTAKRGIRSRIISHINGSKNGNKDIHKLIQDGNEVRVRWLKKTKHGQSAESLEQDALDDYIIKYGRLPQCNKRFEWNKHTFRDKVIKFLKGK